MTHKNRPKFTRCASASARCLWCAPCSFHTRGEFHMRRLFCFMCASVLVPSLARAQAPPPIRIGDAVVSTSLRSRMYSWDWFGDAPNGEYTYSGSLLRFGLTESKPKLDWQIEFAVPALVGMPTTAVMPAPLGQLGLGG